MGFLFNSMFLIEHISPPQNVENDSEIDFQRQTAEES